MQNYFTLSLLLSTIILVSCRPGDEVEVEKQRLIKFPNENLQNPTQQQSDETRRILEEIKKINIALGYVKNPTQTNQHNPNILDADTYLYPQPAYNHPIFSNYNNRISLSPTIRNLRRNQPIIARKIVHHHSLMLPQLISIPENYFYPVEHLRPPNAEQPHKFNSSLENELKESDTSSSHEVPQKLMAISNDVTSIIEYAPKVSEDDENRLKSINNEEYKELLLNNVKKIVEEASLKKSKSSLDSADEPKAMNSRKQLPIKLVLLPSQFQDLMMMQNSGILGQPKTANKSEKSEENSTKLKQVAEKSVDKLSKGPFAFLKPHLLPPQKIEAIQNFSNKQQKIKHHQKQQQKVTTNDNSDKNGDDDDDDDDDKDDQDRDENEKGIFFGHKGMIETQKQALKDGGIIIQRLKVRKGGIAIAGPGGVATAGSGGTAIVGPGGVALTHPKSLTIAGPGAKVLALPESYDLEKAILKAKGKSILEEGRLVATGPAIYYHPENDEEEKENLRTDTEIY